MCSQINFVCGIRQLPDSYANNAGARGRTPATYVLYIMISDIIIYSFKMLVIILDSLMSFTKVRLKRLSKWDVCIYKV